LGCGCAASRGPSKSSGNEKEHAVVSRKRAFSWVGAFALGVLLLAHFTLGGLRSARSVGRLVLRNLGLASDETAWVRREAQCPEALAAIQARVPPDHQVIVHAENDEVALEIAFYCFPRTVVFRRANRPTPEMRLEPLGRHTWAVWIPPRGSEQPE